jgi:heme exporter protein C
MIQFNDYLKPKVVFNFMNKLFLILCIYWIILIIASIYTCFWIPSTDFQQGDNYLIIYIHVPSAWISIILYTFVAIFSLIFLLKKHPLIYKAAKLLAEIGIFFTAITLLTGSFWGKPTWGTFWVWDARLTSVLVLFFLFLGYLSFNYVMNLSVKSMTNSSILAIIGFINIPIIKYSVDWWNTLHQSSSITQNYSAMDISMFIPLILCLFSLILYIIFIFMFKLRIEIILDKINSYYV